MQFWWVLLTGPNTVYRENFVHGAKEWTGIGKYFVTMVGPQQLQRSWVSMLVKEKQVQQGQNC